MLTKRHLSVATNASGRHLNVPIYTINQGNPGPKVYIQSSIHGAEVQGNVVMYHLLQKLSQHKVLGEIVLVPNCNPVGTNIKAGEYTLGRFDPVNGTNWNRGYYHNSDDVTEFVETLTPAASQTEITAQFKAFLKSKIEAKLADSWGLGLAQQLNLTLQTLSVDADFVLDLHNGPVATRHIYVPEYAKSSASLFNIPHTILIPNLFAGALDEATFCNWWSLSNALTDKQIPFSLDVEAFTVEMGSQEVIDFDEGAKDADSILSYLSAKGAIEEKIEPLQMTRYATYLKNYKTLFTQFGGMVEYCVKPGQHVNKGDTLAKVLNIDELDNANAVKSINAPCDLIAILHFPSASVLSGTQLYKCFTEYFEL